jgi:tape measure domain-containing protein
MARGKTRFTIELLDKLSKPAKQIGAALDSVSKHGQQAGRSLGKSFEGVGIGGVAMGNLVAQGAARALGALADLGAGAIATIAEFTTFAQNSELAFTRLAKHGASGAKLFDHARNLAVEFGMDVQSTSDSFRKLLAAQFNPALATDIIKMGADLRSLGGTAEDVKGAVRAISQIKGTGKLQGDELNQLAEAGLSINLIREEIGKLMGGKSVGEVLKLQEAGKIDADTAVAGILNAVKAKTGSKELGEAGKLFADSTLDGMAGRLKAKAQNLGVDLGQRLIPVVTKFAEPLADRLSKFLASPKAQAGIDRLVSGIERGFTIAQVVLSKVVPLGERFFNGFIAKVGPALPGLASNAQGFMAALDKPELAESIGRWGERLGVVASMLLKIGGFALQVIPSLIRLGDTVQRPFDVIRSAAERVIGLAATWGPAIVDGLVRGLEAGVGRIAAAASKVAGAVTGQLQKVFNFGSPSKYTEQRGEWISEGLQIGMDRVKPVPDWLSRDPMNDFGPRASSVGTMPSIATGGGVVVHFAPVFHVEQQAGQSAEETLEDLETMTRRVLDDALEELALAAGA